jgi:RsiW-degrading membrane proteinase PrsW (M82 family)
MKTILFSLILFLLSYLTSAENCHKTSDFWFYDEECNKHCGVICIITIFLAGPTLLGIAALIICCLCGGCGGCGYVGYKKCCGSNKV